MNRRFVLFAASGWEASRFVVVMFILAGIFNREVLVERSLLLFWALSPSLVMCFGLLLGAFFPDRFFSSRAPGFPLFLAVGKVLQLFPALLLLGYRLVGYRLSILPSTIDPDGVSVVFSPVVRILAVIVLLDLLVFLFLLFTSRSELPSPVEKTGTNLFTVTTVEED